MPSADELIDSGIYPGGPGCITGALLLALAIAPAVLLDDQPWKGVAVGNAIAYFVLGFSWTMLGTRYTRGLKTLGILLWNITIPVSLVLLVIALIT